jgi:hypothetical protein
MKIMAHEVGESEIYEYQLASHLTKYRVPMYWLSESITEAIIQTTPPGSIEWYDMHLPFEAAVFMLPKGMLTHKTDGDCAYICYARMRAGVEYRAPLIPGKAYGSVNGGLVIGASVDAGYFLHWNVPLQWYGPKTTMAQIHELMTKFSVHEHGTAIPLRDQGSMTQDDHTLGAGVAHLLFSTLLLMTARPELVTGGQMTHRAPAKKHREAKEFWTPTIIGEHYLLRREHAEYQGGTHASPRFHWVKGFWREQPYGPQRSLRKTLWIEPYFRGGDFSG